MEKELEAVGTLRKFADSSVQASVMKVLGELPEGKTGAVVAVADLDGARLAAMARLPKGWSVVGVLGRRWDGSFEGQAAAIWSW